MLFKCAHTLQPSDANRSHTVTNGRKHFTVDIHCHIHVPETDALLADKIPDSSGRTVVDSNTLTADINRNQQSAILPKLTDPTVRLSDRNEYGTSLQAGDLIFVHPGRPVVPGDDIVIQMHDGENEPLRALLKRLIRRTTTKLMIEQYNPAGQRELKMSQVAAIHRVLRSKELYGL